MDYKIYQYAALFSPTDKEKKDGVKPEIIVQPTTIIAKDDAEANFKAARAVPKEYEDKLSQITLAVRPF